MSPKTFIHTPHPLTLPWLLLSLPLVTWDTLYVFLRPHSMPSGFLHSPIWTPYALYGQIDYIYGLKAYESHNGFTAAQSALNVIETLGYIYYLVKWYSQSANSQVKGRDGAKMLLVGYSAAVMTVSKTVLYWLNEYYSGFDNIGHNDIWSLVFLWIIPNGLWLVFPTISMILPFGAEIIKGLVGVESTKSE
ncbi:hypothetical protein QBC38DRAFT_280353 [Podospora fimiseda]|uniref:C6 transcription factor n=1 Tax=Podospora fimiseda TaxID=252190 RepID=A0AAN7BKP0_9PEZI|nr:hypothetical protein QBC38DRAFT_280353 [Podospora fimiseda]